MSNCPSEIRRLDPSNKIKSPVCKLCVHGHGTIKISDTIFHHHNNDSSSVQSSENLHSLSKDVSTTVQVNLPSSTISSDSQPEKESKTADEFSECLLVLGGDWQWMASIYGYTGPNGGHFCKDCLITLTNVVKGKIHTPTPLPKYQNYVPDVIKFEDRTYQEMDTNAKQFIESGLPKSNVSDFENCELPPLFKGEGSVSETSSCMPLHISSGVGLQVLNIVEKEAIKLDDTVREAKGQANENISTLMDERKKLEDSYSEQIEKLNLMKSKRDESSSYLSEFTKEHANFLEKNGIKYVDIT